MDRRERGEALEAQVEEAVADLEQQMAQGFTEGFMQMLEWYSQFHTYSPLNTLLIMMQRPGAKLCAGFRKWEKLGYHVRQGEKAIWIRSPMMKKMTDHSTGEVREVLLGFLGTPVFDVSQLVEEVELPSFTESLDGDFDSYYALAVSAIGASGIVVKEDTLPQGIHGMSTGGSIYVNRELSVSEKFLCLLHELGHELLHHGEDREDTDRQQRELEAESISFVLARIYGLDNPFSRNYILHWKGTVEGLHDSLTRIHLAVKKAVTMLGIEPIQPKAITEAA